MIVQSGTAAPAAGRPARKRTDEAAAIADAFAQQREDEALLAGQQAAFDYDMQEKAEVQRESNALRDLQLEQSKRDDEIVKKYIEMI